MKYVKQPTDEALRIHYEADVVDIHCHPSLKVKLFNYDIYSDTHYFLDIPGVPVYPSPDDDIFPMQYDLPKMYRGGVDAIFSSIHVVERGLIDNSWKLKLGDEILKIFGSQFDQAIERNTESGPFVQAVEIIDRMEAQMKEAQNRGFKARYAHNFDELNQALQNNEMCFIHALEGAHMLGRNYTDPSTYIQRLESFFDFGVCSITLGHFMPNNVCVPVQGISPKTRENLGFNYDYNQFVNRGLSDIGKDVVSRMLELGMIIDLNHVSPQGRSEILDMNDARGSNKRPIIFSHNGIRKNVPGELGTPTDSEIKRIQDCNGSIGIIFMKYWLDETEGLPDDGLENIVQTVKDISGICGGSFDNISIGSDMDGFTHPIDDLYYCEQMVRLTQALLDAQISEADIKKILGGNALRVLKEGWLKN